MLSILSVSYVSGFGVKTGQPYICFATTNGTLIKDEIKEWIEQNSERFWLGLSVDGTKAMHNLNRSNSYDQIDTNFH